MSEFFGEATVKLRPDLTGFITQLRTDLKTAIEAVENGARPPVIRIRPALTRDFVGDLRRQVNAAVDQAQRGVKPIVVRAQIADFPRGQLREISRRSIAGTGAAAAGAADFSSRAQGARQFQDAASRILNTERVLNSVLAERVPILGRISDETRERTRGSRSASAQISEAVKETGAQRALASALGDVDASRLEGLGVQQRSSLQSRAIANLARVEARAGVELENSLDDVARARAAGVQIVAREQRLGLQRVIDDEARAREQQRQALIASNAAMRENARETSRTARGQEQLRRGALATSLSFLGIRGATLAASASFLAGAAAIGVFAKALQNATDFATSLNILRATTAATAQEMNAAREAARALGADITLPGVTASDAAEAMVELARAGLSVQESIAGTRGVLQLATAAAISNAQAVELAANALNAFQLQGRDATRVADVFANAANAAQGSIVDIGIAFQQAAAAGRQVGLSFEDTATFLTVLAQNGLRGSDAGTSLRTALIRLIRPTEAAKERLRELGVEVRDARGNLRPDVFIQLAEATRNLAPAARDAVIALVGGQDAFRAISILGRQSIEDFVALRRQLREQGTAAELAAARNEGLRGSLDALSNTLSTAGTRIGQGVTPALQGLLAGITASTAAFASSSEAASLFGGALDSIELAGSTLSATLQVIGPPLTAVAGAFAAITDAIGVPSLLAAVAAYKLLPPILASVTGAFRAASAAALTFAEVNALGAGFTGASRLNIAVRQLAGSFNLLTLGIGAAALGLTFLLTRESAAERATRHLTEAVDGLARAQEAARSARAQSTDATLGINAQRLGVLEAQRAVAVARGNLADARSAKGTFERRRAQLELAVALDNVRIAQTRLDEALTAQRESQAAAVQADANRRAELEKLVDALREQLSVSQDVARSVAAAGGRPGANAAQAAILAQTSGVRTFTQALEEQIATLREQNTAESRAFADRLALIQAVSGALNQLPDEERINIVLNADNARKAIQDLANGFGLTVQQMREQLANALSDPTISGDLRQAIIALLDRLRVPNKKLFADVGSEGGKAFSEAAANTIKTDTSIETAIAGVVTRASNQLLGLERQALDISIAGGTDQEVLANLLQQEATARRILAEQQKAFAAGKVAEESVRRAQEQLNNVVVQRRNLQEQIANDAKASADEAKREADERAKEADERVLGRQGRARERAQNRITDAQSTEGLADDIRATIAFRNLIRRQINLIKERVKDRQAQIDAIRALQAIERDLNRSIADLNDQRDEAIQSRLAERNQLDIEFAVMNENTAAEIRAREREIQRLRKLQSQTRKGSLEYRRYRNLILEQQNAIDEARNAQKERNNALEQLFFEFLQRQRGFASQLLGNLIPIDIAGALTATAGPVPTTAGGSGAELPGGPGEGLAARKINTDLQASAAAGGPAGPTRGQGSAQIDVLHRILAVLERMEKGDRAPQAKNAKKIGGSVMDVM